MNFFYFLIVYLLIFLLFINVGSISTINSLLLGIGFEDNINNKNEHLKCEKATKNIFIFFFFNAEYFSK
jgi:hypothetical protein